MKNIRTNKLQNRINNRKRIIEFLKKHPCVDCGETELVVLEFDHVRDKKYTISQILFSTWKLVKSEMDKCEVRCANCHRRKTAKYFGW